MVIQMRLPDITQPFGTWLFEMVNTVVNHVISQIAQQESTKKPPNQPAKQRRKQGQQNYRYQQAKRDRHDQPLFVIRVLMVNTMKKKADTFLELTARHKVKHKAMKYIFKQRPEYKPCKKQAEKTAECHAHIKTLPY